MATCEYIKKKIEEGLQGAKADVQNPAEDGMHFQATITYNGFSDKSIVEQHRLVMDILKEDLATNTIHAIQLRTKSQ